MGNDVDKQNTDGKKSKKEPLWVTAGVLIIIIGAAKYIWFPTLFHFRFQIMYIAAFLAIVTISSIIEEKFIAEPDRCYTCYLAVIIVAITLFILMSLGHSNPYW